MEFSAPWGRFLILVSTLASIFVLGLALFIWSSRSETAVGLALAVLIAAIPLGSLLFVIRGYRLDGAHLYVRRLLWETAVDLRGLESVRSAPNGLRGSIRLFGNGGLFSISGLFWSRSLGRYRAFVTDQANAVVLGVGGRTLVVSPGDPNAFVAKLLECHPRLKIDTAGQEGQRR